MSEIKLRTNEYWGRKSGGIKKVYAETKQGERVHIRDDKIIKVRTYTKKTGKR